MADSNILVKEADANEELARNGLDASIAEVL
jgi:hypothetical protein